MTLEQKIARDNKKIDGMSDAYLNWVFGGYPDKTLLLFLELNKQKRTILTESEYSRLECIMRSENPNDLELLRELIDQFRTKRLKYEAKQRRVLKTKTNGK